MASGPRLYVGRPAVAPQRFGLLQVATVVDDPDAHWRNGVEWEPLDCDESLATTEACPTPPPAKTLTPRGQRQSEADAFTVYDFINCSAPSFTDATLRERLAASLSLGEGRAVERALWTGSPQGTPSLTVGATVTTLGGGAALTPVAFLSALEGAIGECYGGIGVVHVPRASIPALDALGLLRQDGERLRTLLGTLVVAGGGYPGTDPTGAAPAAGEAWGYVTGGVTIRRSGVEFVGDAPREYVDKANNDAALIAERTYVLTLDDCCHFGAVIDLAGCC